ncbi:hypothetical protein CKO12_02700 [Chromatium okenii]|uniref:FimV/HubP family polar landmark protein n=1 Tax=Chromatium okenii TaxID=61644 RepID=UPI001907BFD0|nr:FimV/HubP family polar landmark protein [Chromatium okenii]MBK1640806.1 hypothetical protein [Chromatium okenii]
MSRKLILAAAATLLFAGTDVVALGLGEIRAYSGLNQPFQGEIALYDVKPEDQDALQIALASQAAFDQAGIERYYDLTKLKFTLETSTTGELVITVTSREPIREPYLDMLVEVYWPQGQLLKEFTVLLEPPERMTTPLRLPTTTRAAARASTAPSSGDNAGFPLLVGPVSTGAGLWQVARTHAPAGATVAQTALALYRNNQDAFTRGNINRLISGRTLIIPTREELLALDATAAEREFTSAVQGGATPRAPLTVVPTDNAQLRLLGARAPAAASLPTAASQPDPAATRLEQDLLIALETGERMRQEAQELRQRVQELEVRLTTIQQQLQPRQGDAASANSTLPTAGTLPPEMSTPVAESPTPAVPDPDTLALVDEPLPPATPLDPSLPLEPPLPTPALLPVPAVTPASNPAPVTVPSAGAVSATTAPAPETATWQTLMLPMAGIAGVAALGMLAIAWFRSRRRPPAAETEADDDDALDLADDFADDGAQTALLPDDDDAGQTALLPPSGKMSASATSLAPRRPLEDDEEPETPLSLISSLSDFEAETDAIDPLSEADIYIVYGKHEEAQALLLKEMQRSPTRLDLKFKLAEACIGAKNLVGLTSVMQSIAALNGDRQQPGQWQQLQAAAAELQKTASAASPDDTDELNSSFLVDIDPHTPPVRIPPAAPLTPPPPVIPPPPHLPLTDDELDFEELMPPSALVENESDIEDSRFAEMTDIQRAVQRPLNAPPRPQPPTPSELEDDELGKLLLQPSSPPELVLPTSAAVALPPLSAPTPVLAAASLAKSPAPPRTPAFSGLTPPAPSLVKSPAPLPEVLELDFDLELKLPTPPPPLAPPPLPPLELPDSEMLQLDDPRLAELHDVESILINAAVEKDLPPPSPSALADTTWQFGNDVWDEIKTKLDLAQAYADMDDADAARDILNEVFAEGDAEQKAAAQRLLDRIK